jgi:hypothetical protein
VRANCPHGFAATNLLTTGPPFAVAGFRRRQLLRGSCHPQATAPGEHDRAAASPRPVRLGLIGLVYPGDPGTAWDFHRSALSALVTRRRHLTPRGSEGRTVTFSSKTVPDETVQCFSTGGSLAHHTRPDCGPSRSVLAWPLRRRPLLDDAGYVPLRREFEQGFLDGHGPAQVRLGPPLPHRLRLSQ